MQNREHFRQAYVLQTYKLQYKTVSQKNLKNQGHWGHKGFLRLPLAVGIIPAQRAAVTPSVVNKK